MIGILVVLILAFDFVISVWNAYASGYNIGMLRKAGNNSGFSRAAAYSGLALALVGMTYVLVVVLSVIAYALQYVGIGVVDYALAFDFLVFGIMIIGFGLMITIQSIIIAAHRKSFGSIAIVLWNTFAEVWDIASYAEGFRASVQMLKANKQSRANAYVIVLVALLIAYIITHAAYKHGLRKAGSQNA
ncbi:MAG: hypothetical protein M1360_01115 [Candidatus Marsarchaeota archaeon]|nr:hypothetical protein [Candidatus Marsarchaeota archaeon]MCL5418522.1 hypothetical protein [Candidatus Marsarchaeota archaeon]